MADSYLIIGAGMAGLAAARELVDELSVSAENITILEARDRVGGRINTDRTLGFPLDLGASWIHGISRNPITALAEKYDVALADATDFESIAIYSADGSRFSDAEISKAYAYVLRGIKAVHDYRDNTLENDQSIQHSLHDIDANAGVDAELLPLVNALYYTDIAQEWAQDTSDISSFMHDEDEAYRGDDKTFVDGYDQIPTAMAEGLNILLNHIVESITTNGDGVNVKTNQGDFNAQRCIVTLPLGVLKANAVRFEPALPANVVGAIERLQFGQFHKIALNFTTSFWDDAEFLIKVGDDIGNYGDGDHVEFFNVGQHLPQNALMLFSTGDYAEQLASMTLAQSTAITMQKLREMYGVDIPDPIGAIRSDWINSRFSQGTYTYWGVGSTDDDNRAFEATIGGKLTFAGEHTSADYIGTVHGAFHSGVAAAQRIFSGNETQS